MKIKVKISGSLKGNLQQLKKEASETTAQIGIFAGTTRNPDKKGSITDMVKLASIHEYGRGHVPRRSFINDTIKEKKIEIIDFMQKVLNKTRSIKQTITLSAVFVESLIKDNAFATKGFGKWKPLAPSTIRRKTTKKGVRGGILRDTGQMQRSIVSKIKSK